MVHREVLVLAFCAGAGAALDEALPKIRERAQLQTGKLPDHVCSQTIDRNVKSPGGSSPRAQDRLQLEVTVIGGKERFAREGSRKFDDTELRDLVHRGVIATGGFALHVRHVFHPGAAEFKPKGEVEDGGRKLLRFDYEVPWENSSYKLAVPPHESVVAFRGHLLADPETFDLAALEVVADEIPRELGMDRSRTSIRFAPLDTGSGRHLFPVSTEVTVAMLDGFVYHNRSELSACREYKAESAISFAGTEAAPKTQAEAPAPSSAIPAGLRMEVAFDEELDLRAVTAGQPFRALLVEPLLAPGGARIAPEGSRIHGRITRIELFAAPANRYEAVLELEAIEAGGGTLPLKAQLRDSGSGSGAIRQQREFMPVFDKKRAGRFDVLATGSGRGLGTLYWDARQPRIRKGYRTIWRTGTGEDR